LRSLAVRRERDIRELWVRATSALNASHCTCQSCSWRRALFAILSASSRRAWALLDSALRLSKAAGVLRAAAKPLLTAVTCARLRQREFLNAASIAARARGVMTAKPRASGWTPSAVNVDFSAPAGPAMAA